MILYFINVCNYNLLIKSINLKKKFEVRCLYFRDLMLKIFVNNI